MSRDGRRGTLLHRCIMTCVILSACAAVIVCVSTVTYTFANEAAHTLQSRDDLEKRVAVLHGDMDHQDSYRDGVSPRMRSHHQRARNERKKGVNKGGKGRERRSVLNREDGFEINIGDDVSSKGHKVNSYFKLMLFYFPKSKCNRDA